MPDGTHVTLAAAPFHGDVCPDGKGASAAWIRASDGVRLRVATWDAPECRGTVILMPGRTEYVEKYCLVAKGFADRGYATIAIDWRGQGLSDRLLDNPLVGHVADFADYQRDVDALLEVAEKMNLPRPWHLLGHSMGGCIGLRTLMRDIGGFASAMFSGPMWGIRIAPHLRVPAHVLKVVMPKLGLGHWTPPGYRKDSYLVTNPFEDNPVRSRV